MEKLVAQGGGKPDQQMNDLNQDLELGPIQTVFSNNLKDSLVAYQGHYDQMQKEKKDLKQQIKGKYNAKLMQVDAANGFDMNEKKSFIMQELQTKINDIDLKFEASVDFLT